MNTVSDLQDFVIGQKRRQNYRNVLASAKQIAQIAGFSPKATDTALAIAASLAERTDTPQPIANATIGAKLARGAKVTASREAHAITAIQRLLDEQAELGIALIEKTQNGAKEKNSYRDFLTPLADAANQRVILSPEFKDPKFKNKWVLFEQAAEWAVEQLPRVESPVIDSDGDGEHGSAKPRKQAKKINMPPGAYGEQELQRLEQMMAARADNLEQLSDSDTAAAWLRRVAQLALRQANTFTKVGASKYFKNTDLETDKGQVSLPLSGDFEPDFEPDFFGENENPDPELTSGGAGGGWSVPPPLVEKSQAVELTSVSPAPLPSNASKLEWAQFYAAQGWAVTPLHYLTDTGACSCRKSDCVKGAGKHPQQGNWTASAPGDAAGVVRNWRAKPRANIGILTGEKSGFVVLDFDGEKGLALLANLTESGLIPVTKIQTTQSGGKHVLLQYFSGLKNNVCLMPGLDIRTDGGQIVAAGSEGAKGLYAWDDWSVPIAAAPEELKHHLLALTAEIGAKKSASKNAASVRQQQPRAHFTSSSTKNQWIYNGGTIAAGGRNRRLFELAAAMRGRCGLSESEIFGELKKIRDQHCEAGSHPVTDCEIATIAASVCSYSAEVTK